MSYIKDVQAYEASQAYLRKEKEEKRKLKQSILENADYACTSSEYEALKNYLNFIEHEELLEALAEFYYEAAQEKTADLV